jgi:hypothetical protein
VQSVLEVRRAAPADRRQTLAEARRRLAEAAAACRPLVQDRPAVRRAYRRCVRRLARDAGGVRAALWSCWRRLFPLLPAAS